MGNGRKSKKNVRNFNPDDVNLVMARLEMGENTINIRFTCTYVHMVERKGNMVLLEAPEVGIKRWIDLSQKTAKGDCINGMIFDSECKDPLVMTFTTIDEDITKEALLDVIDLLISGEDYEDEEDEYEGDIKFSASEEQKEIMTNLMIERGIIPS